MQGVKRLALVFVFWVLAASAATIAPRDGLKAASIVAAAALYMRCAAGDCTLDHALAAGAAWLTLSIAAEIITGGRAHLLVRSVLMLTWVIAPAVFARNPAS